MIFQFRKYILALVMTVCLLSGLSVSASAASIYSYDGHELPSLPVVQSGYDYSVIYTYKSVYYLCISDVAYYTQGYEIKTGTSSNLYTFSYDGSAWVLDSKVYTGYGHIITGAYDGFCWANVDIYDAGGWVGLAGRTPTAVDVIPTLTSSVTNVTSNSAVLTVAAVDLDPAKEYQLYLTITINSTASDVVATFSGVTTWADSVEITDLTPSTVHTFVFNLLEDGEDIAVTSKNVFTTLSSGSDDSGSGDTGDSSGIDYTSFFERILTKLDTIINSIGISTGLGETEVFQNISNKLDEIISHLTDSENPAEDAMKDATSEVTQTVTDNFFGDSAKGQAVTVSDVGNLADTQSTVKTIFQSDYTVTDFFGLFSDSSFFGWFSVETAMDLNPISYGGVSAVDTDDPYNMQAYYENLEKVRGKR